MTILKAIVPAMLCALVACKPRNSAYKTVLNDPILFCKTVKQLNDVVLENNFPPVIASRNYAYANIAAYECIAAGDSCFKSLVGQINQLPQMPIAGQGQIVNYSLAALLSFTKVGNAVTFPEGSMMSYYAYLTNMADSLGMPADELQNTIQYADSVVATILRWSKKDNYAQTRSAEKYFVQTNINNRWIPTPPMYASAIEPHWASIRPLALDSASQFLPPAPPVFNVTVRNSTYYKAMLAVKQIGDSLTEVQKEIANFWDDNPFKMNVVGHASYATKKFSPPGHWMNIVGIAAKKAHANFNTTVAAYTHTAITLFDGFISCWGEKYRSNTARPETVINKYLAEDWHPFIQTPPFPSYTSGHATVSAAAAEVMTAWFGDNLLLSDTSLLEFGIKARNITSFRAAAQEAALSRLYGGIHFKHDNDEGNKVGIKIGQYIVQKLVFIDTAPCRNNNK